jgi:hypothetical protein
MFSPTQLDWARIKRLGRYLISKPRVVTDYEWQSRPKYITVETGPSWEKQRIRTQSDSDWAGDRQSRKSVSGGAMYFGSMLVKSWSKDQHVIATSSGEAELYAANLGAQQAIGMKSIAKDFGYDIGIIFIDMGACAAIGIASRQGLGRVRHIDVADLRRGEAEAHRVEQNPRGTQHGGLGDQTNVS